MEFAGIYEFCEKKAATSKFYFASTNLDLSDITGSVQFQWFQGLLQHASKVVNAGFLLQTTSDSLHPMSCNFIARVRKDYSELERSNHDDVILVSNLLRPIRFNSRMDVVDGKYESTAMKRPT